MWVEIVIIVVELVDEHCILYDTYRVDSINIYIYNINDNILYIIYTNSSNCDS
jgi:hypothetical protein